MSPMKPVLLSSDSIPAAASEQDTPCSGVSGATRMLASLRMALPGFLTPATITIRRLLCEVARLNGEWVPWHLTSLRSHEQHMHDARVCCVQPSVRGSAHSQEAHGCSCAMLLFHT